MRRREDVGAAGDAVGLHADPIVAAYVVTTPHSTSLSVSAREMIGPAPVTVTSPRVIAPASSSVPRDDAVGNDLVLHAVQFVDAVDDDRVGALAGDLRAHRDEEVGEIDDFGFHRDVVQRGHALGEHAASIAFLVAPTLGNRNSTVAPCSRRPRDSAIR